MNGIGAKLLLKVGVKVLVAVKLQLVVKLVDGVKLQDRFKIGASPKSPLLGGQTIAVVVTVVGALDKARALSSVGPSQKGLFLVEVGLLRPPTSHD